MSKIFTSDANVAVVLASHTTPWLTMRNKEQNSAFEKFRANQSNIYAIVAVQIWVTFYFFVTVLSGITYYPSSLATAAFVLAFCPIVLGWCLIILRLARRTHNAFIPEAQYLHFISSLASMWIFSICVSFCLNVANIGQNGICRDGYEAYEGLTCSYSSRHQMPEDMMIISVIIPAALSMIAKSARWEWVVFSYIFSITSMYVIMFYFSLAHSITSCTLFIPICICLMYEHQRQNVALFLLTQSQEQLIEENERLAEETHANELRHMIGNVAHDLKTPLSAYVSGMEVIISETKELQSAAAIDPSSNTFRGLSSILESIFQMKNTNEFMLMTINRCIDYTKASQGLKLVPRMETINFAEAINLPLGCMRSLLDKKIEINLLPINSNISANIITDKQWLQENILCLLSNAVKYSVGGVVTISACLAENERYGSQKSMKTEPSKQVVRINIEDTGIGISEDVIYKLFNPFKQAQRLAGGTGLGLYSLAKRIEALGGSYGAQKRPDGKQGSLFWFTVPYRPDVTLSIDIEGPKSQIAAVALRNQTMSMDTSAMSPVSQHSSRVMNKLNILIVDDSLSILKMSSMMLRRQGHTISTAENGAEALQIMTAAFHSALDFKSSSSRTENIKYDVVLMDLQMPIMDGLEATNRLRKLERSNLSHATLLDAEHSSSKVDGLSATANDAVESFVRHQLIIGVSACSDNETMEAAFAAGIDDFIPKPFTLKSFNETYMKCLQARERARSADHSRGPTNKDQEEVSKGYIGWGI